MGQIRLIVRAGVIEAVAREVQGGLFPASSRYGFVEDLFLFAEDGFVRQTFFRKALPFSCRAGSFSKRRFAMS
ncbi:MAG: hypothetical protein II189_06700, partial [Lachnospiraceae bacterium]|nr:hypothetical protein [Lachnospiraceae bacterium]